MPVIWQLTFAPAPAVSSKIQTQVLTHNDVHYIVGLLLFAAEGGSVDALLGERILDVTTGTTRDVDVTISYRDAAGENWCLKGIEVKDEKRPLDVQRVEGLCMKFLDMPSITHRGIVSASDYTEPAKKKAQAHGVDLFHFTQWDLGEFQFEHIEFDTPDFRVNERTDRWLDGPHVSIGVQSLSLNREIMSLDLSETCPILDKNGEQLTTNPTMKHLADHFVRTASNHKGSHLEDNTLGMPMTMSTTIQVVDQAYVLVNGERLKIVEAKVSGTVIYEDTPRIPQFRCLKRDGEALPFAGAAVIELHDRKLVGLTVSTADRSLRGRLITVEERESRIHRRSV